MLDDPLDWLFSPDAMTLDPPERLASVDESDRLAQMSEAFAACYG